MNKIFSILFTGILISALFSCTPEKLTDDLNEPMACCDGTVPILPPPPPPPPPTEDGDDN